ncbi:PAS domain S-box protein [Salinarimonas soli]|uniref:PAS domain S-box protein n=1 Tax=Salinarimonas soli TaxID=1638099 RepID=UPI001F0A9069|nr:PAS domain S-box protein [Salinarimonas soli]
MEVERARLEAALESISDGFFALDSSYRIVAFNAASERYFARPRAEVLGRVVWEAFPAAAHGVYRRTYTRVMETREAAAFEHRSEVRPDRIIRVHATPTPDGGIGVAFNDITDQVAAEVAVRATQGRFRAAVRASDHVLYEWNPATNELLLSGNVERVLGYSPDEMEGGLARWIAVTHPDDRAAFANEIDRVLRDGGPFRLDFRVVRKNGEVGEVEDEGYFLDDEAGRVMLGFVRDVTARKRAEREREAERQRLAAVLQQTPVGIIIAEAPSGRLISGNDEVARIWRQDFKRSEAVAGYGVYRGFHREDGHELAPDEWPLARSITKGEVVINEEVDFLRGDGTRGTLLLNSAPIHDEEGRITAGVVAFTDVTDKALAERRQGLLINELNHRVKNTLATVQSLAAQSFRDISPESGASLQRFNERLFALARAHDVLTRENWDGAELRSVLDEVLAPHRQGGRQRISMSGPRMRLSPRAALSLAMAVHELGTNAAKYGSLSVRDGCVNLTWTLDKAKLHLLWQESGGPAVEKPTRTGFGSRLISRYLAAELGGEVDLAFAPEGVRCVLSAPRDLIEGHGLLDTLAHAPSAAGAW